MSGFEKFGVIDIGNSGLKIGLADRTNGLQLAGLQTLYWSHPSDQQKSPPKEWTDNRAVFRASMNDLDSIAHVFAECRHHGGVKGPLTWLVGSVQPNAFESVRRMMAEMYPTDSIRPVGYRDSGIPVQVDAPELVGIDRILAAAEARRSCNREAEIIVVQAGTAITVDWIDATGAFCGGAIMPGISLTLKYLALGTAQLPWLAPPSDPRTVHLPGKNTRDAILAGVNASVVGGIERLIETYRRQNASDSNPTEIVLSGGDGLWLSKALTMPHKVVEHLVLRSLAHLSPIDVGRGDPT